MVVLLAHLHVRTQLETQGHPSAVRLQIVKLCSVIAQAVSAGLAHPARPTTQTTVLGVPKKVGADAAAADISESISTADAVVSALPAVQNV